MKKDLKPKMEAVKMLLDMAKGADVERLKKKKKKKSDPMADNEAEPDGDE